MTKEYLILFNIRLLHTQLYSIILNMYKYCYTILMVRKKGNIEENKIGKIREKRI